MLQATALLLAHPVMAVLQIPHPVQVLYIFLVLLIPLLAGERYKLSLVKITVGAIILMFHH